MLLSRHTVQDTEEWEEKHFLVTADDSDFSHDQADVPLVGFSSNGVYLVTGDAAGRVVVWQTSGLGSGRSGELDI